MPSDNLLEFVVEGACNESFYFHSLGRPVRGRFDFGRVPEIAGKAKMSLFPDGIPGERVGIALDSGEAYLIEPLQEGKHTRERQEVERLGMQIQPARTELGRKHVPTWLHRLKGAVESGLARIVMGELPKKIMGTPELAIFSPMRSPHDEAIERLTAAFQTIAAALSSRSK